MSRQDGYTAVEALAAVAILGLAMGGLATCMQVIGASQAKARARLEQTVLERAADQRLERLLALNAPFRSDQSSHLVGNGQTLEVGCGASQRCAARIENGNLTIQGGDGARKTYRLPEGEAPRFVYIGSYSTSDIWPPAVLPPPAPSWQTLSAVIVQGKSGGADKPMAVAKVWRQQRTDCEYDVVIQDCRAAAS